MSLKLRIAAAAFLCAAALAAAAAASPAPHTLYGGGAEYQVTRADEPAGIHRLHFAGDETLLTVTAQTRATMKIWGVLNVPFIYDSLAVWRRGALVTLSASFQKSDAAQHFWITRDGAGYRSSAGETIAAAALLPTNHWNIAAVSQTVLYNTLNGELARVRFAAAAPDTVMINQQPMSAMRYDSSGDLDISLWYDADGRWTQLQFFIFGEQYRFTYQPPEPPPDDG